MHTVLPVNLKTEQIWVVIVNRMSGRLLSCCCCSFMSVIGIIDTPTHQQADRQAGRLSTCCCWWYFHLGFIAPCLSLGQSSGLCVHVCVCASIYICIFFVLMLSMKTIEFHFPNSVSFEHIQFCHCSGFISFVWYVEYMTNLSSSSHLSLQVTDDIRSFWWSPEFRQHGSQPKSRSVSFFHLLGQCFFGLREPPSCVMLSGWLYCCQVPGCVWEESKIVCACMSACACLNLHVRLWLCQFVAMSSCKRT